MNEIPIYFFGAVVLIILCRVGAVCLLALGGFVWRGGRKWCDACGRKTCRIRPLEHLTKGRLFPRCPRCGGRVKPHPPILTRRLASRLLRKEDGWDEWTIRLLRRVAKTGQMSTPLEARLKTPPERCEANMTDRKCTPDQGSMQTKHPQSHTHIPELTSHSPDQSDRPDLKSEGCVSLPFFRENV